MSHPNTIAAMISGGLASLTVYLLNRYASTSLNAAQGAGIATAYASLILFVGRRGLKGAITGVWDGVWNGSPKSDPAPPEPVQAEPTDPVEAQS